MKKLTKEQFIQKAKEVHGNKYDYSKVDYINSTTKVIIICLIHGEFEQTPNIHLSNRGCYYCGNLKNSESKKYNKEEFIKKAISVHGNKYDYSKVIYMNSWTKVIIICPIHGEFEQIPNSHLLGNDCFICGNIKISKSKISNTEEFIFKARKVHGDKYDYNKIVYKGANKKIIIICPEHKEFEQTPGSHLFGQGCPKCGHIVVTNKLRSTQEEFIEKSIKVHGNKYSYSKVIYLKDNTKVTITCLEHGEFEQRPNHHLRGSGCPKCSSSKGELALEAIFKKYKIEAKSRYCIPEVVNKLYYDFYLPEYNLLIEFHGIQHYEYIPFFHDGDFSFTDQKDRDNYIRHNARSFRYRYLEFNYKQLKYMTKKEFEEMVINKINKLSTNKLNLLKF